MGRPAAKKGDKIVSVTPGDIHLLVVPMSPSPVPLPHPCKSDLKMKLAKRVNVQGKAGAVKGSKSRHMPPHIPTPPGVSFTKPPKNQAEVFTGSTNVNYEGRKAAMLGDTGLMCADPVDTPVGVLVVPPGTVYVGGGMSGGAAARAQARIAAMKAAAAHCHKWITDNMPLGAEREEAHRKLCEATGHPVDVATGKVFTGVVVLRLRGRIPVRLAIDYSTGRAQEDGPFGHGWRHELERHLLITDAFIAHRNQHGHFAAFEPIGAGEEAQNLADGLTLSHHGHYLAVRDANGLEDVFLLPEDYRKGWMLPLAGMRDPFRNCVRLHYEDRRLAKITDSAGREVQLTYGADHRVIQVLLKDDPQVAARPIVTCRYDRAGDLVAVGDPLGHERRFAYDHHLLVQETDRNGFSFYFAYDEAQRCVLTWGDGGRLYRRLRYDPERQQSHVVDSYGGQTLHRLSASGRVEDRIDPLGHAWSKVLDEEGRTLSTTDPLGRSWTFAYDDAGRLVERSDPAGTGCSLTYDDLGRVTDVNYELGLALAIEHDPATGKVTSLRLGDQGPALRYDWTSRGDLREVACDGRTTWLFDHDAQGNLVSLQQPGGSHQRHGYDRAGRLVRLENERGLSVGFDWDPAGRLIGLHRPGQLAEERLLDPEGNVVCRRRGQSEATFSYASWNLPMEAAGTGLRQAFRSAYDEETRLVALKIDGGEHRFDYDLCGRLTGHRHPDGGVERLERDAVGRIVSLIDRAGRKATVAYDDLGNVCEREESNGEITRWDFNEQLKLARSSNDTMACESSFDDAGHATRQVFRFPDGPVYALTLDDGWLVFEDTGIRFAHMGDATDRVTATACSAWTAPVLYRPGSEQMTIRYPNGITEVLAFHASGRRRSQQIRNRGGEIINQRRYHYDPAGRLLAIEDDLRGKARYVYDLNERLTEVTWSGAAARTERYGYDRSENLFRDGEFWQFDRANRLTSRPGRAYRYDPCGCRIEEIASGRGTTRYRYNARNQLVGAVLPDGREAAYGYDATGRRVIKRLGELTTHYLWNGDLLAAERRSDGSARTYIHRRGDHALLAWVDQAGDGSRSYFVHNDHLGQPLEVTDEHGRLVWAAVQDAFGATVAMIADVVEQPIRVPGQYADRETGLYYNHDRYFDPATASYLSEDPLGLDAGLNPYAYCPNPVAQTDPLGRCVGANPAYDPRQAELDAIRQIYWGSEGHQLMTQALQTGDIGDICRAGEVLGAETGFGWEPWTEAVNGREPSDGGDAGMVDWENRRVLIDINANSQTIADTINHEYNTVRMVQVQAQQQGVEIPRTRHEAVGMIPPAAAFPIGHRHEVMDSYVRDPQGADQFMQEGLPNPNDP